MSRKISAHALPRGNDEGGGCQIALDCRSPDIAEALGVLGAVNRLIERHRERRKNRSIGMD